MGSQQEIECISGDTDLAKRVGRAGPQTRALTTLNEKVGSLVSLRDKINGGTGLYGKKTRRRSRNRLIRNC